MLWIDTAYSRTFSAHVHRYACTDAGPRGRRPSGHHNESNGYTRTNADSRSLYDPTAVTETPVATEELVTPAPPVGVASTTVSEPTATALRLTKWKLYERSLTQTSSG